MDFKRGIESDSASSVGRAAHDIGLHLASALGLAGINAALGRANFRRPPARRLLRRRY